MRAAYLSRTSDVYWAPRSLLSRFNSHSLYRPGGVYDVAFLPLVGRGGHVLLSLSTPTGVVIFIPDLTDATGLARAFEKSRWLVLPCACLDEGVKMRVQRVVMPDGL